MSREKIFEEVKCIFREIFDDESLELRDETTAEDIEDWDSLEQINLIVAMEKQFSIRFNVTEVGNLKNVGEMVNLIMEKVPNNE